MEKKKILRKPEEKRVHSMWRNKDKSYSKFPSETMHAGCQQRAIFIDLGGTRTLNQLKNF